MFINCGGGSAPFNDDAYEGDLTDGGPAAFSFVPGKWGYSSTGTYMEKENNNPTFIAKNDYNMSVKGVYETARLAPQSLKYYALCLPNGKYKVQLHFAEIMYSNDQTFSSLGRRIFDISIQVSKMIFKKHACSSKNLFISGDFNLQIPS